MRDPSVRAGLAVLLGMTNLFVRYESPNPKMSAHLTDYDYDLPRELIAQHPLPRREDSRMMVLLISRK